MRKTNDFKIKIWTIIKDEKRDLIIIDREKRPNCRGILLKWYKYHCNKDGNEDWVEESHLLTRKQGCNVCHSFKVLKGYNDIPTTSPWMVKYFQGGYEEACLYTNKSHQEIYPICPECGKVKNESICISSINRYKSINCECSDGFSYPEKVMISILNQLNIKYITQYNKSNDKWCDNYKYDFFLIDYDTIIETHGEQHYRDSQWGSYEGQHKIDTNKMNLALKNIKGSYITLDCRISDIEYIKKSINKNKDLTKILSTHYIDWLEADKFAIKNLTKEICYYYDNNDVKIKDIANKYNISVTTVRRYLNKGKILGWCNYNPESYNRQRKIFVVELNTVYDGLRECARELSKMNSNIKYSGIQRAVKTKAEYNGFHFEYQDE